MRRQHSTASDARIQIDGLLAVVLLFAFPLVGCDSRAEVAQDVSPPKRVDLLDELDAMKSSIDLAQTKFREDFVDLKKTRIAAQLRVGDLDKELARNDELIANADALLARLYDLLQQDYVVISGIEISPGSLGGDGG